MGQSQSSSYHPSAVGSHNFQTALPPGQQQQASSTREAACQESRAPRSYAQVGKRWSSLTVSSRGNTHQPLIPVGLRRSGAGPIRRRPMPPEYASFDDLDQHDLRFRSASLPMRFDEEALLAAQKRRSLHRISATPRDPPLLEESESLYGHDSVDSKDDAASAAAPYESDHGHAPTPLSPSLALALKAGLGSGSLRRTADGSLAVQLDTDRPYGKISLGIRELECEETAPQMPANASARDDEASASRGRDYLLAFWERPPSFQQTPPDEAEEPRPAFAEQDEATPRGHDPCWRSDWEDRRQDTNSASVTCSSKEDRGVSTLLQPDSLSSFSSHEEASRRLESEESERDAVEARGLISYSTTETAESASQKHVGGNGTDASDSAPLRIPQEQHRLSQAETASSHTGPAHPTQERSQSTVYSAAAPSSDFEPAMEAANHGPISDQEPAAAQEHATVQNQVTPHVAQQLDAVDRVDTTLPDAQPSTPSALRRPRTFSLIGVFKGRGRRASDVSVSEPVPKPSSATVQPTAAHSQPQFDTVPATQQAPGRPTSSTPRMSGKSLTQAAGLEPSVDRQVFSHDSGPADIDPEVTGNPVPTSKIDTAHTTTSLKSRRNPTASLRAKSHQQAQGKSHLSSLTIIPWWKQSSLKRKGSAGIMAGQVAPRRRSLKGASGKHLDDKLRPEDEHWEDFEDDDGREVTLIPAAAPVLAPLSEDIGKTKQGPNAWLWPRKSGVSKNIGAHEDMPHPVRRTTRDETVTFGAVSPPMANTSTLPSGSEREKVSPPSDQPTASLSRELILTGVPSAASSSTSSFSSLAPPKPPVPLPPLRRSKRSLRSRHAAEEACHDSETSSLSASSAAAHAGGVATRANYYYQGSPNLSESPTSAGGHTEVSGPDTYAPRGGQSTPATSMIDGCSRKTSQALLSQAASDKAMDCPAFYIAGPGGFAPAMSPLSPVFPRLSSSDVGSRIASDAGTKEILLSDKESDDGKDHVHPARLPSSTKAKRSAMVEDEPHPDLHILTPGGLAASRRPIFGALPTAVRHGEPLAGGEPFQVAVTSVDHRGHDRDGTDNTSFHSLLGNKPGSIRTPSEFSRHNSRNGPALRLRRKSSGAAESFVTAHSRDVSGSRKVSAEADRDASQAAGLASPYAAEFDESVPLPQAEPSKPSPSRPLPPIPEPHTPSTRPRSSSYSQAGPPLSPSAIYTQIEAEGIPHGRQSWSSADGPWLAEVVSQNYVLAPARGLAIAQQAQLELGETARSQPPPSRVRADAGDIDLVPPTEAKLPTWSQDVGRTETPAEPGSRLLVRKLSINASSQEGAKAPFADTGVQASLAALKALESPGDDPRTFWARQRIFGERDPSAAPFGAHEPFMSVAHVEESLHDLVGPRQRRRANPYSTARSLRSSDGFSSSASRRARRGDFDFSQASRASRRHGRDRASFADPSSASLADTSGAASDSDVAAMLVAQQLLGQRRRTRSKHRTTRLSGESAHARARASPQLHQDHPPLASPPTSSIPYFGHRDRPLVKVTSPTNGFGAQGNVSFSDRDELVAPVSRKRLDHEAPVRASSQASGRAVKGRSASSPSPAELECRRGSSSSQAAPIPFPSSMDHSAQGSYLQIDPYSLAESDRQAYRQALEQQLLELERAERDANHRSRRKSGTQTSLKGDREARTRHRTRAQRTSGASGFYSHSPKGEFDVLPREAATHYRVATNKSSDPRHVAQSGKASSASRSRGKGRRPSKQGYTGDDILAWQTGLEAPCSPPPNDAVSLPSVEA